MSPWNRILNYARDVNRKVGTALTTEKVKQIRKSLLIWGAVLTILSIIGIIIGMVVIFSGFGDAASSMLTVGRTTLMLSSNCPAMGEPGWFECEKDQMQNGFNNDKNQFEQNFEDRKNNMVDGFSSAFSSTMTGMIIFAISGFLLSIGVVLIKAGLTILVVGEGSKFLDTAPRCPKCGDPVEENEVYCNKCGADLRNKKKCSSCGTQNDVEDAFCRNCGNKLS